MNQLPNSSYALEFSHPEEQSMAAPWLWLSIMSLATAGVFSVLLVMARTPYLGELIPYVDFFHTALVIHVNMSVLVWNLSFACLLWSLIARPSFLLLNKAIFGLICCAAILIAIAGFLPHANPVISNYIPVLDNPVFLIGLTVFAIGIGMQVLMSLATTPSVGRGLLPDGVIRLGLSCAAISLLVALLVFLSTWLLLSKELVTHSYYEALFWGGGHILQYTYTLVMMVCWLCLGAAARIQMVMSERIISVIFLAGLLPIFVTPLIFYNYEVIDPRHRQMFIWQMSFGGSLATFPLGLAVFYGLVKRITESDRQRAAHSALMTSLILFGCGGAIGFMITGNDVTVPAHYHGSIVGVTLALMGVAYDVLPKMGFTKINFKWANIQLWGYAAGQFMHILGLVWSGGYGVQRKVAGAAQGLDSIERVAGMGLMGMGGLISSLGGLLFVIIVIRALLNRGEAKHQHPGPSESSEREP